MPTNTNQNQNQNPQNKSSEKNNNPGGRNQFSDDATPSQPNRGGQANQNQGQNRSGGSDSDR